MQNYKNHVRYFVPHHFILVPLVLIHLIYQIVRFVQEPGFDRADSVLLAVIVAGTPIISRFYGLRVQNRVVRLEEQVRYRRLLPADLAFQAENLPLSQIIALRFAADAELKELVTRVSGGELKTSKEIKMAVKNWRADNLRV